MPSFIKLARPQVEYLIDLIEDMDSETTYTAHQRSYTLPKLKRLAKDSDSCRLAYQDIEYLLELIEDDDLEDPAVKSIRASTQNTLQSILELQVEKFQGLKDLEDQRAARRERRLQRTLDSIEGTKS